MNNPSMKTPSLTFSTAIGNAITFDVTDGNVEQVTLSVANGTLALGQTAGLTSATGNGTNIITIEGSTASINAALNGLTYGGNFGTYGSDTLTIAANDTGSASAPVTTNTVNISIPEVTLAPLDNIPGDQTVNENATLSFSNAVGNAITFSTTDGNVEQVTLSVNNGTIALGQTAGLTSIDGNAPTQSLLQVPLTASTLL